MTTPEHLVVIANETVPPPAGAMIIRFAGIPAVGESTLVGISEMRDAAAAIMKERFASWLYRWARESGLLALAEWRGYSWWWYAPLSERSPLRSGIIVRL